MKRLGRITRQKRRNRPKGRNKRVYDNGHKWVEKEEERARTGSTKGRREGEKRKRKKNEEKTAKRRRKRLKREERVGNAQAEKGRYRVAREF